MYIRETINSQAILSQIYLFVSHVDKQNNLSGKKTICIFIIYLAAGM